MLELSDLGVGALRKQELAVSRPHAGGRGFFIQGQIEVLREATTDAPTLPDPRTYFMFRPLEGHFQAAGADGKPHWTGGADLRFEWAWVKGVTYHDIDTLEDVRALSSNRDLRYCNGAEALLALLAELDPDGVLHLKTTVPAVADDKVLLREGWLSRYLLDGPLTADERTTLVQRLRQLPTDRKPNSWLRR